VTQLYDLIEDALRDLPLGGFRDFHDFIAGDDGDGIAIGIEAHTFAGNIVYDDAIEVFRNQLLASVLENVLCLRGKSDYNLRTLFQG
jgi:hypothetical protein